jgi:pantoate--beta-alanine ligase
VKRALQELILSHPFTVIDYVSLCDPFTLEDVETVKGEVLLALAVKVGKTRLIDNGLLNEASESEHLIEKG